MSPSPLWAWGSFWLLIGSLLLFDLVLHRGARVQSSRSAIGWSVTWILAGLGFTGVVAAASGRDAASDYLAAYAIEKSLSIDNLFVWMIIFRSLGIATPSQRSVLLWGVLGALVFRALFIFAGLEVIERWDWIAYVLSALLAWSAYKTLRESPSEKGQARLVRTVSRFLPVAEGGSPGSFLVCQDGRWKATPLLIALCIVEVSDILFAIDSVPAVLSVSHDALVVYGSNAFAILGLRSLYQVLARTLSGLRYLHYGIGAVLAFAAAKLAVSDWIHVPGLLAVGIVATCIGLAIWLSLRGNGERVDAFICTSSGPSSRRHHEGSR